MAKLTKRQLNELTSILRDLKKVKSFILSAETKVCRDTRLTNPDNYSNSNGKTVVPIDKEIGSELVHLSGSIVNLDMFVSDHS